MMGLSVITEYTDKIFEEWESFEVKYGDIQNIEEQIIF